MKPSSWFHLVTWERVRCGAVSWSSKKQPTVALSSTEAEYRGAAIVACEVVWLQKLFLDLGQSVDAPVVIYCDNISSILLVNNPVYHARTKHIEVHYHFIREKVLAKEIDLIMSVPKIKLLTFSQRL